MLCKEKLFLGILQNSLENNCAGVFLLIKSQAVCNFLQKRPHHRCLRVNHVKFLRTPILKNWSNGSSRRETSEANIACLLSIKVSRSALKVFSEQHYLRPSKLSPNNKNEWSNQEIRKIRLLNQREKTLSFFSFSKQALKVNSSVTTICWCDLYFECTFWNFGY